MSQARNAVVGILFNWYERVVGAVSVIRALLQGFDPWRLLTLPELGRGEPSLDMIPCQA